VSDFIRQAVNREVMKENLDLELLLTELVVRNQVDIIFLSRLFVQQDALIRKLYTLLRHLLKEIDRKRYKEEIAKIEAYRKKLDGELSIEQEKWKKVLFYLAKKDYKGLKEYLDRLKYPLRSNYHT